MPWKNKEVEKIARVRWRKKHQEERLAYEKEYRKTHKTLLNVITGKYLKNNKEKRLLTQKSWRDRNRQKCAEYAKQYQIFHPGLWKQRDPVKLRQNRQTAKFNYKNKPGGRLNAAVSFAVWRSLKSGAKAGRHWESLMGYTLAQLQHHLEKQFTSEMSWENYGLYWHVDHKIPITAFNFQVVEDIDFKKCWSLDNLQPLEKITNIKKGNKLSIPFQPSLTI